MTTYSTVEALQALCRLGDRWSGSGGHKAGKGHPKVTLSRLRTDFVLAEYVGNFNHHDNSRF